MPQSLATLAEGVRAQQAITDHAALLDLAHDAIFIHDDQGRITYWNRGAERSYGYLRDDAMGQVAHELLRTKFPIPVSEIEDVLAASGYWEGELTHHTSDGRALTEETLWAHSEIDGHLRGTLEICRDVTARKAAEAELARGAVELKALNDALRRRKRGWSVPISTLSSLRTPRPTIFRSRYAPFQGPSASSPVGMRASLEPTPTNTSRSPSTVANVCRK